MKFNEIEKMACNYIGKLTYSHEEINNNIIKILEDCLKNNIKLDFNEDNYISIIEIYYKIKRIYYDDFIKGIINLSINNINLVKILDNLTNN